VLCNFRIKVLWHPGKINFDATNSFGEWCRRTLNHQAPEALPCNGKRERAFTTIVEHHTSACNCRFSSTQFGLRSEYTYHPRSSSYDHHYTARGTNIRSSLEKIGLTVSFRIRRETLDHTMTRKNVLLPMDICSGRTANLSCITPTEPKRKNQRALYQRPPSTRSS
jgi:hypothetical protein